MDTLGTPSPAPEPTRIPRWVIPVIGLAVVFGIGIGVVIGLVAGNDGTAAAAASTTTAGATTLAPDDTAVPTSTRPLETSTTQASGGPTQDAAAYGAVTLTGDPLPRLGTDPTDTAVGLAFPDIAGHDYTGNPVSITNDGRAKLILAVAHWCPYCRQEVPVVRDWYAGAVLPDNVAMYAAIIWTDPTRDNFPPGAWLQSEGWNVPTIADDALGTAAAALGVNAVPFWVLVYDDGTVAARGTGALPAEAIDGLVDSLAQGPPDAADDEGTP